MVNYDTTVKVKRKTMNLAKVAAHTQVSQRMLRYYEELGLIAPKRADNNYRDYSDSDIEVIQKIKILNDAGMNLKSIHWLLPCFDLNSQSFRLCKIANQLVEQELQVITEKLTRLQQSQTLLQAFLDKSQQLQAANQQAPV